VSIAFVLVSEPRDPYRCGHPGPQQHPRPRLLPPQTSRRQNPQRSHARPETTHQRRRLPPTPRRHDPLNEHGSGGATRDDSQIQRGRQIPEHRHFGTATPGPDPNATTTRPTPHARVRDTLLTQTGFVLERRACSPRRDIRGPERPSAHGPEEARFLVSRAINARWMVGAESPTLVRAPSRAPLTCENEWSG
jgi:hypothetical protein